MKKDIENFTIIIEKFKTLLSVIDKNVEQISVIK